MTDFLSALLLSSALVSLAGLLAPDGKTGRYVRFVLALVGFLVMAAPLLSLRDGMEGWTDGLTGTEQEGADAVTVAYEGAVRDGLARALSLPPEAVEVDILVSSEGGSYQIETVWIRIDRPFDGEVASSYLERTLPPDCEVMLFGG